MGDCKVMMNMRQKMQKLASGFSLVELMVTVTLMAVVGIGVASMIDYVNSTRVRVQTSVALIEDVNQAELYMRSKLKTADRIEFDVSAITPNPAEFSAECLLLLGRETIDRVGLNLVNNSGTVETESYRGPGMGSAFTLGTWFKRDNASFTGTETLARWGRYSQDDNSSFAMVITQDGGLSARIGPRFFYATNVDGLHDNRWHHLIVSYDNETSSTVLDSSNFTLYVDGYPRDITFADDDIELQIDTGGSADVFEIGSAFSSDNSSAFNGFLANVELYSTAASRSNASAIYSPAFAPSNMTLEVSWDFASLSDDVVTDASANARNGQAANLSVSLPTVTTTDERYVGDVFAMVDRPNDDNDNFEMLHRANFNDCPSSNSEAAGFTKIAKDIFVRPDATAFFSRSTSDANDVLFNYGYRSGNGNVTFAFQAKPKKLALNKKFTDEDFCLADPNLVLNPPPGVASCNIARGYAYIATDYDSATDELFIPGASYWSDNTTYYNIPNAPSAIRAQWSSETGVMSYTIADSTTVSIDEWEKTMRTLSYRPTSEEYTPQKDIVISLGFLPMMVGNEFHFYDFVEAATGDVVDWEASQTAANNSMFCGTAGYLATVTSEEENDFLLERFRKSTGSVPAGWLGGSDVDTPGTWVWEENSPEAGLQFWHQTNMASGNASGRPRRSNGLAVPDGSYTLTDYVTFPGTPAGSFTRRTTVSTDPSVTLAYHNMATKEPNNAGGSDTNNAEPYLQIVGSTLGNGYWNDLPDTRDCQDNEKYQPCGYYVEYGGRPGESLNSLVFERTIDLSAQREFCAQN